MRPPRSALMPKPAHLSSCSVAEELVCSGHILWVMGRIHRLGVNERLLRLSLASYRLPRTIGVDGVHSQKLVATRGIVAGSGFATTELRLLLLGLIKDLLAKWGAKPT